MFKVHERREDQERSNKPKVSIKIHITTSWTITTGLIDDVRGFV
jgi:hypothetical protein